MPSGMEGRQRTWFSFPSLNAEQDLAEVNDISTEGEEVFIETLHEGESKYGEALKLMAHRSWPKAAELLKEIIELGIGPEDAPEVAITLGISPFAYHTDHLTSIGSQRNPYASMGEEPTALVWRV
jgi:hypothetical protein